MSVTQKEQKVFSVFCFLKGMKVLQNLFRNEGQFSGSHLK